jgi:rod shape-determining protein MreD
VKSILGGMLLLTLQILVLNRLDMSALIYPQIYFIILLSLPVNTMHWTLMLTGFFLGYLVDWFSDTQGLHAATLTFIGFLRYGYLKMVLDKDAFLSGMRPVYRETEISWYLVYISVFSLSFHFILFILADFTFAHVFDTLQKTLYSSFLSILIILLMQFVFNIRLKND